MSTKIEWTDKTWNPVHGCTPISPGCANCYARQMATRLAGRYGYPEAPHQFDVTLRPDRLDQPHGWRKARRVFVCSMADLFHDEVPVEFMWRVWQVMRDSPRHTFQILTKRPARMKRLLKTYIADHEFGYKPLNNVHLGITAENQKMADERIPILRQIPAAVSFVSLEPLLEGIDLTTLTGDFVDDGETNKRTFSRLVDGLDQVIVGAETGPGKRKMELDWARDLRDQCQAAGVPFFFKKDSQGNREIDGRLWEQMPR